MRALWNHAAKRGEALEEVKRFLERAERDSAQAEPLPSALQAGWQIIPCGLAELGISAETMARAVQDEPALVEDARLERAERKGWL